MSPSPRLLPWLALSLLGMLACDPGALGRPRVAADSPSATAPTKHTPADTPWAAAEIEGVDPCAELGVIVARTSVELHATRAGTLRGGEARLYAAGEQVFEIEAEDELAALEVQRAELEEAKATRERYAAERLARARELGSAEQLGDYLPAKERDAARDAHTVSTRELSRADAAREAASARLEAQRARLRVGQLDAPFAGRIVRELAVVGAWVEAGQALARFASTQELVLRIGLPAEHTLPPSFEVRWTWPEQPEQRYDAVLHAARGDVDELSGLRIYEARVDAHSLGTHPLGASVRVELSTCHGHPPPPGDPDHEAP